MTTGERIAAVAPIVAVVQFVGTWTALAVVVDGHDPARDAISELAAIGASHRPLMTASLILFGVLVAPFAPLLRRALHPYGTTAAVFVALNAAGSIAVGITPCSPGCPGATTSVMDLGHLLAAIASYTGLVGAPIATWWALHRAGSSPGLASASLALGSVTAIGLLVLATGLAGVWGGAMQRAATATGDLWYLLVAVILLRSNGHLTSAARHVTETGESPQNRSR